MKHERGRNSALSKISRTKALFCLAGTLLLTACKEGDTDTKLFSFQEQVGWINGSCLVIENGALDIGADVTVVMLEDQQSIATATISGIANSGEECPALLDDRRSVNESGERHFYAVSFATPMPTALLAVGILDPSSKLSIADNRVVGDIDGDGQLEMFGSCSTSEGINFYVSPELENIGGSHWVGYYYLGYDITPTCPD